MTDIDLDKVRRAFEEKYGKKTKGKRWVNSKSTKVDGINFPSELEASVYAQLKLLVRAGKYRDLRRQETIRLVGNLRIKIDFVVFNIERGVDECHEAKGKRMPRYETIVQAWPGCVDMDLIEWGGSAARPVIVRTVRGKRGVDR